MTEAIHIPGLRCPCGSPDLTIVAPGDEPERHDLIGMLEPGAPMRGWRSPRCAGWPASADVATHA